METRSNNFLVGMVTLLLIAAAVIFTVWLARFGDGDKKEYDIFFKQSVAGLAKGSGVSFAGVPAGQVEEIALWKNDPEFVRVRIQIDKEVPVLQGTVATISGVGFTGVSEITLDGAQKGAPALTVPGPAGVPVIPTKPGALGQLLNNAPLLLERLSTLTERLSNLLTDRNAESVANILDNVAALTGELKKQGPELQATMAATRVAIVQAGNAAEEIGQLADTTDGILRDDARPLVAELNRTVASANRSLSQVDKAIAEARPGIQAFSQQTLPQVNQLVSDLRAMSASLKAVSDRLDREGAGGLISSPALPDYEPKGR